MRTSGYKVRDRQEEWFVPSTVTMEDQALQSQGLDLWYLTAGKANSRSLVYCTPYANGSRHFLVPSRKGRGFPKLVIAKSSGLAKQTSLVVPLFQPDHRMEQLRMGILQKRRCDALTHKRHQNYYVESQAILTATTATGEIGGKGKGQKESQKRKHEFFPYLPRAEPSWQAALVGVDTQLIRNKQWFNTLASLCERAI